MFDFAVQHINNHIFNHQRKVRNLKVAACVVCMVIAVLVLKMMGVI